MLHPRIIRMHAAREEGGERGDVGRVHVSFEEWCGGAGAAARVSRRHTCGSPLRILAHILDGVCALLRSSRCLSHLVLRFMYSSTRNGRWSVDTRGALRVNAGRHACARAQHVRGRCAYRGAGVCFDQRERGRVVGRIMLETERRQRASWHMRHVADLQISLSHDISLRICYLVRPPRRRGPLAHTELYNTARPSTAVRLYGP